MHDDECSSLHQLVVLLKEVKNYYTSNLAFKSKHTLRIQLGRGIAHCSSNEH